jgi:lipopolysaccharide export system protein LptA
MKTLKTIGVICISILFIVSFAACGQKGDAKSTQSGTTSANTGAVAYPAKSGIVTYEVKLIGDQTQVLYFDDNGKKEARVTTTTFDMGSTKVQSQSIEINADGFLIKYDPEKKTGTKSKYYGSLSSSSGVTDTSAISAKQKDEYKFKDLGKKTILGKECTGYSMEVMGMQTEAWMWKNILMASKTYLSKDTSKDPMEINAVKIEMDVPVPANVFTVPADVKLTEN